MKKIFLFLAVSIAFLSFSKAQDTLIQNVGSNFNTKVEVCFDTLVKELIQCDGIYYIDSLDLLPEYNNLIVMCRELLGEIYFHSFLCQNTTKQSGENDRRILVFKEEFSSPYIYRIEQLTIEQQAIYNNFINKLK